MIEAFWGAEYAIVFMSQDGENFIFDKKEDAEKFAREECQYGIVVEV